MYDSVMSAALSGGSERRLRHYNRQCERVLGHDASTWLCAGVEALVVLAQLEHDSEQNGVLKETTTADDRALRIAPRHRAVHRTPL